MRHDQLSDAGRETHREIDQRLATPAEKRTLANLLLNQELEFIAAGNTGFDEDGNWRIRIDGSGDLVVEVRTSGTWTNKQTWNA